MELECKEADSRDATVPGSMDGCTGTGAVYAGLGSRGAFIGGSREGFGCEAVTVSLFGISFMANSCSSISGSWLCERDAGEGGMLGVVLLRFVGLSARDVRFDATSVAVAVLRCSRGCVVRYCWNQREVQHTQLLKSISKGACSNDVDDTSRRSSDGGSRVPGVAAGAGGAQP